MKEVWSSNPFASRKFIKGKLVYQREPQGGEFFARPYAYQDGILSVPIDSVEERIPAVLPPNRIKFNCVDI